MPRSAEKSPAHRPFPPGAGRGERALDACRTNVRADQGKGAAAPRRGFTLVELLVVVMIIALLAALVTPAVMNAQRSARAAAVKAEIDLLHMALMNYKNEYGSFPPENMRSLWDDTASPPQVNRAHSAYKHLKRIFPRIQEQEVDGGASNRSPYYFMAQMSPAQALVFWLQGYFDNPQFPLTNGVVIGDPVPRAGSAAGSRKKMFDFDEARLYAASAYWQPLLAPSAPGPQTFLANRNAAPPFAANYPVFFPGSQQTGLPYVYFSNAAYADSRQPTAGPTFNEVFYRATAVNGGNTVAWPYLRSTAMPNDSWSACHWNANEFQLVAAGIDMSYGDASATSPVSFPGPFPGWGMVVPAGLIPGVTNASVLGHGDNITNFASGNLRDAAEKLLAQ